MYTQFYNEQHILVYHVCVHGVCIIQHQPQIHFGEHIEYIVILDLMTIYSETWVL